MTKIFLMRHAKAEAATGGMADFDRPLAPRGLEDAARMGRMLPARWGVPERAVCSGARRTRETLAALGFATDATFSDALFSGDAADYVAALAAERAQTVLLVGHNPTVRDAAMRLAGSGDPEALRRLREGFPTATMAVLEFDAPLGELRPGACRLEAFVTPSDQPAA